VLVFVNHHYHLAFSTQLVAWALGFEPSYFAKAFKRHTKESMAKHLRRVRLHRAKKLLENPYLSVEEIAKQTGFTDPSYFARVFRVVFGISPSQFRQITQTAPGEVSNRRK
jgi:two-component system response regulator YesN